MTVGEAPRLAPAAWVHARGSITLARPRVMAIINVTPDSFYDGGRLYDQQQPRLDAVLEAARRHVEHGADLLDVGGESTRPGADPVEPAQERQRVVPIIEALCADPALRDVPISVDTRRASVAEAALEAGASIVNDVSGLADPAMAEVVARRGAGVVIGHLRGQPRTMQAQVRFGDVLAEVAAELRERVEAAVAAGVEPERIVVDPGIGFGKTAEQSAALVAAAGMLGEATGCPVLIGASRKSFLGALTKAPVEQRLAGSLAAALVAVDNGASIVRVHDVAQTVQALTVSRSIRRAHRLLAPTATTAVAVAREAAR